MYIFVFFILAAALALPTYGISLAAFFILKRSYDNRTVGAILAQAVISMREGVTKELFRVNRAAIDKLFTRFGVHGTGDICYFDGYFMRWGIFSHPMIDSGRRFSLRVTYHPRGAVDIIAAPGIDEEVLSDYLVGIGSFRLAMSGLIAEENLKQKR